MHTRYIPKIQISNKYAEIRVACIRLYNTYVINSEFPPNRGEVLPYYYYYTKEFSKNTIILHDTVFINSKIDPSLLNTKNYHFLCQALLLTHQTF